MPYRSYLLNGRVTSRIDYTDGVFMIHVDDAIAEVAAALKVPVAQVSAVETAAAPPLATVVIPPAVASAVQPTPLEALVAALAASPVVAADPILKAALAAIKVV